MIDRVESRGIEQLPGLFHKFRRWLRRATYLLLVAVLPAAPIAAASDPLRLDALSFRPAEQTLEHWAPLQRDLRVAPFDVAPEVRPDDIWRQYHLELLAVAVVFTFILLLLLLLLVNARRMRALLQRVDDLSEIVGRSPVVAMAWRNLPGWPLQFVSDSIDRFGYSADDLLSGAIKYADLIHPDDLPRVEAEVAD